MNLKRTATDENPTGSVQNKDLDCWSKDPHAQCLRVELRGGIFLLLPYSHFLFARYEKGQKTDSLQISFASHNVHVRGWHLGELALALHKSSIDWIRELQMDEKLSFLKAHNASDVAFIETIEIDEVRLPVADDGQ